MGALRRQRHARRVVAGVLRVGRGVVRVGLGKALFNVGRIYLSIVQVLPGMTLELMERVVAVERSYTVAASKG